MLPAPCTGGNKSKCQIPLVRSIFPTLVDTKQEKYLNGNKPESKIVNRSEGTPKADKPDEPADASYFVCFHF